MKRKTSILHILGNSLCLIFIIVFSSNGKAQDTAKYPVRWGFEYDLMAPRIGAWHSFNLSGYYGHGRIKHSLVLAHININNKHLTDESFSKDNLNAFGYRFEIYSRENLTRWSTGLMMLYSMHSVTTVLNQQEGHFNTFFIGVPFGYTWCLWDHLTINPNISILVPLTNRTVKIGMDEVQQAPWGLEPGIRIGFRF